MAKKTKPNPGNKFSDFKGRGVKYIAEDLGLTGAEVNLMLEQLGYLQGRVTAWLPTEKAGPEGVLWIWQNAKDSTGSRFLRWSYQVEREIRAMLRPVSQDQYAALERLVHELRDKVEELEKRPKVG